jgi:hypothetical protein
VGGDLLAAIRAGAALKTVDREPMEVKDDAEVSEAGIFGALKQAMAQRRFTTQPDEEDDEPSAFDSDQD